MLFRSVALKQNGEEIFIRPGHVGDADGLSLQALEAAERRVFSRQQVQTAAVGPGGELDVKALLQRLQPAQRHPHPGVGLTGGDRLQQHIGGVAEVNKLNVEVVFTEYLLLYICVCICAAVYLLLNMYCWISATGYLLLYICCLISTAEYLLLNIYC